MAKEHEKIPKVKNAPRKIRSQSEIVSNGNIICTTFNAVIGCKRQQSPCDFQGLVFLGKGGRRWGRSEAEPFCPVSQRARAARPALPGFPPQRVSIIASLVCRVNAKPREANWILITSRRLLGTAVLFHSSEKSTNICSKKVPFLAKNHESKWILWFYELTFKTDI